MRKFIPRLFNFLSAILAVFLFISWQDFGSLLSLISTKVSFLKFFDAMGTWFMNNEQLKVLFIPALILLISVIFFISSSIDKGIKKHNNVMSLPLKNATYNPLFFATGSLAAVGMMKALSLCMKNGFLGEYTINAYDWFGLGKFFATSIPVVAAALFYLVVGVLVILLTLGTKKLHKKNFFVRLLVFLTYIILFFASYKAINDTFLSQSPAFGNFDVSLLWNFKGTGEFKSWEFARTDWKWYVMFSSAVLFIVFYVIFGIIRMHKNNKLMKSVPIVKTEYQSNAKKSNDTLASNSEINDPLFVLPEPEEVVETEIIEKTTVKEVVYEKDNLDQLFGTTFEFKNVTMVKKDGSTDYLVNKQKFLSLSNSNTTMSFRLELDLAIKLILKYPLIGKDKYEEHKIWFKIDDIKILNKDAVIDIIKQAYDTVLNNK